MSSVIVHLLNTSRILLSKQLNSLIHLKRWSPRGRIPQSDGFDEIDDDIDFNDRHRNTNFDNRNPKLRENYNEGYSPPEKRFQRNDGFRERNDFRPENRYQPQRFYDREPSQRFVQRKPYNATFEKDNRPKDRQIDDDIDFNYRYRNTNFDNRNPKLRENYNEGYGPPEKRFQRNDGFRERNDFRPENRYQPKQFYDREPSKRFVQRKPYNATFEKDNRPKERLKLPNPHTVTEENKIDILNEIIAPWYKYSLDHQMSIVHNDSATCLKNLGSKLIQHNPQFRLTESGLPCYLDSPIGRSLADKRNRTQYAIWPGLDGNPKTVGFLIGSPGKHENVVCVFPDGCVTTSQSHNKLGELFQDYLRNVSPLEVCQNFGDGKNWLNFIVRSNENGDHMLIARLHPQKLKAEELEGEKERLRNFFEPLSEEHRIKSFYFQAVQGSDIVHERSPYQLIFGEAAIEETLSGVKYLIHPGSYFYQNKFNGEELCKSVLKSLNLSSEDIVIDLSCGIGLLGLQAAPFAKKVIGFEASKLDVEYARKNVELNGFNNVTIVNSIASDGLTRYREELWDKDVSVIADPQLDGLRSFMPSKLRCMESVKRIVYVTPRPPKSDMKVFGNLLQLLSPERPKRGIEGPPFVAVNAIPYRINPHSQNYGLIVNLERHSRFSN